MARPSKLTPALQRRICLNIEKGCGSLEAAAAAAGISRSTLHDWRARGRAGEVPFEAFLDATETAREAGKSKALAAIAADGSWQSKAWLLERSFPRQYSLQYTRLHELMRVDLAAAMDRVEKLRGRVLTQDQFEAVLAAMADETDAEPAAISDPRKGAALLDSGPPVPPVPTVPMREEMP